jgi:uncharacterized membrane protein YfcA
VTAWLWLLILAYVQNVSFAIVSRARNRDHFGYHAIAAVFSNVTWYVTFRELVVADMSWWLLIPYTAGTVAGSLTGSRVSMVFERLLGART